MKNVIVIGGGAAGMMAAIASAEAGNKVEIIEKNEKTGKKLFITGKGRCNLTNACDTAELFQNIITNPKFLYSSIYGFDNWMVYSFFEEAGVPLKIERGNRVFPESDHSSDILAALQRKLKELNVKVTLRTTVKDVIIREGTAKGVILQNGKKQYADSVIVATGGLSYPGTGSTGDGYRFAKTAGHSIKECSPSLVPLVAGEEWCKDIMGLSLKNVHVTLQADSHKLYDGFGEMLFTHFGVSGPLILSASTKLGGWMKNNRLMEPVDLYINLKPALSEQQLDERLQKDFFRYQNRKLIHAMDDLLPKKLIPVIIQVSGVDSEKKVNGLSKEERLQLVHTLQKLPLHIIGTRDYNEAIITRGGIDVKEINPQTMESRLIHGLFFAGEILDTDAVTGGYNLQIAWSTGHTAGASS